MPTPVVRKERSHIVRNLFLLVCGVVAFVYAIAMVVSALSTNDFVDEKTQQLESVGFSHVEISRTHGTPPDTTAEVNVSDDCRVTLTWVPDSESHVSFWLYQMKDKWNTDIVVSTAAELNKLPLNCH